MFCTSQKKQTKKGKLNPRLCTRFMVTWARVNNPKKLPAETETYKASQAYADNVHDTPEAKLADMPSRTQAARNVDPDGATKTKHENL